jgi:hypothetical protein
MAEIIAPHLDAVGLDRQVVLHELHRLLVREVVEIGVVVLDQPDEAIPERVHLGLIAVVHGPECGGFRLVEAEVDGDQRLAVGANGVEEDVETGFALVGSWRRRGMGGNGGQGEDQPGREHEAYGRHGVGSFLNRYRVSSAALYLEIFVIFEPWMPTPPISPFWSKMNA